MGTIPSNLARVPNILSSRTMLTSITRASVDLLRLQTQMASGKALNAPSDDPIATSTVTLLDDIIERRDQRVRNLAHAESVFGNADSAMGELNDMLLEAKSIASSQIGIGSDAQTRANQAQIIDAMIMQARNLANTKYQDLYLFSGTSTATEPIQGLIGGLRYAGAGDGLVTDLGMSRTLEITMSGERAFGAVSARVQGDRDLDPTMLATTRLADLGGARGLGVSLGSVDVNVDGNVESVDLSAAHDVQDVMDALQAAINLHDATAVVDIDPVSQSRLRITPGTATSITVLDPGAPATAADLGIAQTFNGGSTLGQDLDPHLVEKTGLAQLTGVTVPLGTMRLSNMGQTRDVDLSGATTVEDVVNIVEGLSLGIRVEISAGKDRLNFVNELSGGMMSIGEVGGGTTATELGVRSFTGATSLADFNDGLGVGIIAGSVDAISGLPDPAADLDLRITAKDGTAFDVDFAGAETVQDVLDAINAAAGAAGLAVPGQFEAALVTDGNGIALNDNSAPPGTNTVVERLNGSTAAEDLGIFGVESSATFAGEDRAKVAVNSVFTHLMALRDALQANDERGITIAGERLEQDISRAAEVRAEIGVRSRRVTDATRREEDLTVQDTALKSQFQDLDFTEAVFRYSLLQQQLQAGMQTASQSTSLSLLDFLR